MRLSLVLVGVVVILAGALFWNTASEPPRPTPAEDSPHSEGSTDEVRHDTGSGNEVVIVEDNSDPTVEPVVDPRATWVLSGQTRRGWKDALPDISVLLRVYAGVEATGEAQQEARVTSDGEGNFKCALQPPTDDVTVVAEASVAGYEIPVVTLVVYRGDEPPTVNVNCYPMDYTIEGVVRDAQGAPIQGARVWTYWSSTEADREGLFSIQATSVHRQTLLYGAAEGYAQVKETVHAQDPGAVFQVDLELVPSFRVRGRVVDEEGQPVEGAAVRTFHGQFNIVESDADGRFLLDHLDPRRGSHQLYARKSGYVEAKTRVTVAGELLEIPDLVLKRGVRVEGVVQDELGKPVSGAALYIGFSPSAYNRLDARSDDSGEFVFPNVGAGDQTLVTSFPGLSPDRRSLHLRDDESERTGIVIQLDAGQFIGGIVLDGDRKPIEGVHVIARHEGEYVGPRQKTDDSGRFRFEGLASNGVGLEFFGTGIVRKNVDVDVLNVEDYEVVIQRSAKVAGRVIDGVTGLPVEEFFIRFVSPDQGERRLGGYSSTWAHQGRRFTGTDGYWDSGEENLAPGTVTGIEVRAPGYAPARFGRVVASLDPDPEHAVVRMSPGGRITGTVVDELDRPMPHVRLSYRPGDHRFRRISAEPHEIRNTTSDEDGSFSYESVPEGSTLLLVEAPGRAVHVDGPFDVSESVVAKRTIRLPAAPEGRIAGILLDTAGVPLVGEHVTLSAQTPTAKQHESVTGEGGTFEFDGLADGRYLVNHRLVSGVYSVNAYTRAVHVTAGESPDVILYPDGPARLKGTITREDGKELPTIVTVTVLATGELAAGEESPPSRGALARDGEFEVTGMQAGEYRVHVFYFKRFEHLSGSTTVTVTGQSSEVQVILKAAQTNR